MILTGVGGNCPRLCLLGLRVGEKPLARPTLRYSKLPTLDSLYSENEKFRHCTEIV